MEIERQLKFNDLMYVALMNLKTRDGKGVLLPARLNLWY